MCRLGVSLQKYENFIVGLLVQRSFAKFRCRKLLQLLRRRRELFAIAIALQREIHALPSNDRLNTRHFSDEKSRLAFGVRVSHRKLDVKAKRRIDHVVRAVHLATPFSRHANGVCVDVNQQRLIPQGRNDSSSVATGQVKNAKVSTAPLLR